MDEMLSTICITMGLNLTSNILYDGIKNIGSLILPHQKSNLLKWIEKWNPTEVDIELIKNNEKLKRIFSIIFDSVQNEFFEEKLSSWGKITDRVLRGKDSEFNAKLYFIQLFTEIPLPALEHLLIIREKKELSYTDIYPEGCPPPQNSISEQNYFGYLFCSTHGLTNIDERGNTVLTGIGNSFIDFIGDKYQNTN